MEMKEPGCGHVPGYVNYQKLYQDVLKTSPKHIFIFHIQPFCQNSLSTKEKRPGNDMKTSLKPPKNSIKT